MKLEIGQGIFGQDLDDIYAKIFEEIRIPVIEKSLYILIRTTSRSVITAKETHCIDVMLKNVGELKKVAIIGATLPVTYMVRIKKKFPDIEFVTINDSEAMLMAENFLKTQFKYTNINLNPIFNDLTHYIKDCDLVIYPETEHMVPFKYLRYKHTMPYFCVNFIYYPNTINTNEIYSIEDMIDTCEMKNVILADARRVYFSEKFKTYYYALDHGC